MQKKGGGFFVGEKNLLNSKSCKDNKTAFVERGRTRGGKRATGKGSRVKGEGNTYITGEEFARER